jgi:hypothetical protein
MTPPRRFSGQAGCRRRLRRLWVSLLVIPTAFGLTLSLAKERAEAAVPLMAMDGSPMGDADLARARGGFRFGGFDFDLGVVARSIVEHAADGSATRLEVVTNFSVPEIGKLANKGTTVSAIAGGPQAGPGDTGGAGAATPATDAVPSVTTLSIGGSTVVDLGGTTQIVHHMLNTFVQNSDVGRVIANEVNLNLHIGGFAARLSGLRAAQALRPAVDAHVLYGMR